MPPTRRSTRWSPAGTRLPELFSTAVDNSALANPNRRGRSPSSCNARTPRCARRRLALGDAASPNRSNDGSSARSPRNGGGGGRPRIANRPDEDGPDNDFNPETFLSTLAASDQPMLQQFGAYLKAKDETISVLQRQVKSEQNKRATQEAIRNYEDTGRSGFQFHPDDIGDLLHTFVIPHIRDSDDQRYYYNLDMAIAEAEDLSRAISMGHAASMAHAASMGHPASMGHSAS